MTQMNDPITLTPGFYQLGIPFFPVYLSMGREGMLIEGGNSATTDIIVRQIEKLGIDPETIKYIALTHSHPDHIGALPRLKKRWPHLKTIASARAAKNLSNEKMLKHFKGMDTAISEIMKSKSEISKIPEALDEYDFTVDILADENSCFDLGNGISWSTCPIPGHAGCQTAFFEKKEGTLVIGDAIGFYNPGKDIFWPNYFESLSDYTDSIKRLATFPANRIALGHNGVIKDNTRKFLDKALKATGEYHQEMLERIGNKETIEDIARDKAELVWSISDRMPPKVAPMLCQLLIEQSLKTSETGNVTFEL